MVIVLRNEVNHGPGYVGNEKGASVLTMTSDPLAMNWML